MASTTTSAQSAAYETPVTDIVTAPRRRYPLRIRPFRILVYGVLTLGAVLFVMPFLWMVTTSLQHSGDIIRGRFIPTLEFMSVTQVEEKDLERTLQDYLDAGELPSYLESVRSQIESSRRQRSMTVGEYLRTQKLGYAELSLNIDIPLINQFWEVHNKYVVVGGAAHYVEAWDESSFSKYFVNSIKIAGLTILAQTITSVLAAYAFARIDFPGRNLLFSIFLATIFIPTMVVLIPNRNTVTSINKFFTEKFPEKQEHWIKKEDVGAIDRSEYKSDAEAEYFAAEAKYFGLKDIRKAIADPIYDVVDAVGLEDFFGLGDFLTIDGPIVWAWMDSWPALVFPFLASTFSIFLLRQFFIQIPEDLWDAARIDGAGHLRFLFQVVLPISRAALVTTILFTFIGTWNALEWPILVTFTDDWRPISYGLYAFQSEAGTDLNLLMAGSVITLIPVLVIYLFAQRQFTEGIATTGLKG